MRKAVIILALVALSSVSTVRASESPAWAPGMSGDLAPLQLLTSIVGTVDPTRHALEVEFNVAVLIDEVALVDEDALDGLPLEANRRLLKEQGLTDAEIDSSRTYGEMTIPFRISEAAGDDPGEFFDYLKQSAAQIERLRASSSAGVAPEHLCSGLLPGSELTARTTLAGCDAPRDILYRCTLTEVGGRSRGTWLRIDAAEPVDASGRSQYCG